MALLRISYQIFVGVGVVACVGDDVGDKVEVGTVVGFGLAVLLLAMLLGLAFNSPHNGANIYIYIYIYIHIHIYIQ